MYGEWTLHPVLVKQIWARYGQAAVDLFASRENAHCSQFFSLQSVNLPLGINALAHVWPHMLLYVFPPLALVPPTVARVRELSQAIDRYWWLCTGPRCLAWLKSRLQPRTETALLNSFLILFLSLSVLLPPQHMME